MSRIDHILGGQVNVSNTEAILATEQDCDACAKVQELHMCQ